MSDSYYRYIFGGKCPYTDEPCETFECEDCEVNKQEKDWIKETEGEISEYDRKHQRNI